MLSEFELWKPCRKIIIKILAITSKKKMVWYFSGTVDWCVCPQPSLPPSPILTPPPILTLLLALLAVSRLRCQQSSTSSSKSAFFSPSLYAVISPHYQGNKSFVPFSNLSDVDSLTKTWKVLERPASDLRFSPSLTGLSF